MGQMVLEPDHRPCGRDGTCEAMREAGKCPFAPCGPITQLHCSVAREGVEERLHSLFDLDPHLQEALGEARDPESWELFMTEATQLLVRDELPDRERGRARPVLAWIGALLTRGILPEWHLQPAGVGVPAEAWQWGQRP